MKRKVTILTIVVAAVFLIGFTTMQSDKTTEDIDKEWTLSAGSIDSLSLLGAEQDIKATIVETEEGTTIVKLAGKVSKKTAKSLNRSNVEKTDLKIVLSDLDGFKLMPNNDGKSELELQIFLGKEVSIENMKIESIVGNVDITVPQDFQGTYVTTAKNGGEVLEVPETKKEQDEVIDINTIGDILIKKPAFSELQ